MYLQDTVGVLTSCWEAIHSDIIFHRVGYGRQSVIYSMLVAVCFDIAWVGSIHALLT